MPVLFEEPLSKRYSAGWCSGAGCFSILCIVATLVLPFFAAFESNNFWMKTGTYLEQPTVSFKHNLVLLLQTRSIETGNAGIVAWATSPHMQRTYERFLRASDVRAWAQHTNNDRRADVWRIEATVPLSQDEEVFGMQLVTFFDFKLQEHVFADFEGLAFVQHDSVLPGSGLMVEGSAKLHQKIPLTPSYSHYFEPLLSPDNKQYEDPRSHLVRELISSYASRNISMDYDERFRVWDSVATGIRSPQFCLNMTIRVEEQPVLYITQFAELLKWAWVQYFSLLVVVGVIVAILKQCVFSNQVLETVVTIDTTGQRKVSSSSRDGRF